MNSTVPRRRRLTAIGLAAGLAVLAMLLPAAAGIVSAHTYSESLVCSTNNQPKLTINLSSYAAYSSPHYYVNTVTITIDSVVDSADSNSNFGTTFSLTKYLSPSTTSHTVTVVVVGGDGQGSHTWTKTLAACQLATATPTATATATATATETPFESFQGETGTPVESVTPPPTSTGSNGSSNSSIPLLALLICLAFGGLGIAAVETQRRSIKR